MRSGFFEWFVSDAAPTQINYSHISSHPENEIPDVHLCGTPGGLRWERLVNANERGYDVITRTITMGHAGFGHAAREVGSMLESRRLDVAILIGVDSYYDPFVLEELFEEQRVLDSIWREAFVPGEAKGWSNSIRGCRG